MPASNYHQWGHITLPHDTLSKFVLLRHPKKCHRNLGFSTSIEGIEAFAKNLLKTTVSDNLETGRTDLGTVSEPHPVHCIDWIGASLWSISRWTSAHAISNTTAGLDYRRITAIRYRKHGTFHCHSSLLDWGTKPVQATQNHWISLVQFICGSF